MQIHSDATWSALNTHQIDKLENNPQKENNIVLKTCRGQGQTGDGYKAHTIHPMLLSIVYT